MGGDLIQALRTANSGLLATQQALDNVARNVANVNTPNYSRKIANLQPQTLGLQGAGVEFGVLTRRVDNELMSTLRLEQGTLSANQTTQDALSRLQQSFGTPESNSALSHMLSSFQSAVEALAMAPQDSLEQQGLVQAGQNVATNLQGLSTEIQTLRQEADKRIGDAIDEVNGLLTGIADLNAKIVRNQSAGYSTADLEDQRDASLDKLSKLIGVRTSVRSSGEVIVFTESGRTLVDGTAQTLSHVPVAKSSALATYATGTFDGLYVGERTTTNDITQDIGSGELAGLIALRDETLPELQSAIDGLSSQFRDQINAAHNRGVAFPGLTTMDGTRMFSSTANETINYVGSADTRLVLLDASGKEVRSTSLRSIAGFPTGAASINQVATAINSWLGTDGSATAANGNLQISVIPQTGYSLAIRDEAGASTGSAAQDNVLDTNGDGVADAGFSAYFGLNDFFVDDAGTSVQDSRIVPASYTYVGANTTLTLRNSGIAGGVATVTINQGDDLDTIKSALGAVAVLDVGLVPEGDGYRLRIAADNAAPLTITEAAGGTLMSDLQLAPSSAGSAASLAVRSDILQAPWLVARGAVQWDASRGVAGAYSLGPGDDTAIQQIAAAMTATNTFKVSGHLSATNTSFVDYAAYVIGDVSQQATAGQTNVEFQQDLVQSLQNKSDSLRGVNLDEEVSDLMLYQQAYSASARVLQVVQSMFDALEKAV